MSVNNLYQYRPGNAFGAMTFSRTSEAVYRGEIDFSFEYRTPQDKGTHTRNSDATYRRLINSATTYTKPAPGRSHSVGSRTRSYTSG